MMTQVKICGLRTEETVAAAIDAGADMIGLVFHEASPRYVDIDAAKALARMASGHVEVVALVVDPDDDRLDEIVSAIGPDWIQLHGQETPDRTRTIGDRYAARVMKAMPISVPSDVAAVSRFDGIADMMLLDAKPPRGASRPGGHGVPFDWTILESARPSQPFMLSGGLSPDNVVDAIRIAKPSAVDVSSGVETAPGVKDAGLIEAFVKAARAAASAPLETLT